MNPNARDGLVFRPARGFAQEDDAPRAIQRHETRRRAAFVAARRARLRGDGCVVCGQSRRMNRRQLKATRRHVDGERHAQRRGVAVPPAVSRIVHQSRHSARRAIHRRTQRRVALARGVERLPQRLLSRPRRLVQRGRRRTLVPRKIPRQRLHRDLHAPVLQRARVVLAIVLRRHRHAHRLARVSIIPDQRRASRFVVPSRPRDFPSRPFRRADPIARRRRVRDRPRQRARRVTVEPNRRRRARPARRRRRLARGARVPQDPARRREVRVARARSRLDSRVDARLDARVVDATRFASFEVRAVARDARHDARRCAAHRDAPHTDARRARVATRAR